VEVAAACPALAVVWALLPAVTTPDELLDPLPRAAVVVCWVVDVTIVVWLPLPVVTTLLSPFATVAEPWLILTTTVRLEVVGAFADGAAF
jgi:hypothetical protein